jgi:hypothetical protein
MKNSTKVLLYAIPSVLLLSCGGGLLGFAHKSRTDRDLAVARLAKVGLPTDPDQIKHTPDSNKDAGELLKEFQTIYATAGNSPVVSAYSNGKRATAQERRDFINAYPKLVRLRKELFTKTELATQLDPSLGKDQLFPQILTWRVTINFAVSEAVVLAAEGKPTEAIGLLAQAAEFAKLIETDPILIGSLNAISIGRKLNREAALIFASSANRPGVSKSMRLYLNSSIPTIDVRRTILDQVCGALDFERDVQNGKITIDDFYDYEEEQEESIADRGLNQLYKIRGVSDMLFARLYTGQADFYEAIPKDRNLHKQRIEAAEEWESKNSTLTGLNSMLLTTIGPFLANTFKAEAQLKAEWRTLNALLTASEMKSKTGKYPATLPVTGQDAIDPFTDKPLKYLLKGEKLTIYSVGEDLSDDNGLLFRPTASSSSGSSSRAQDTGFSIPYVVPQRLQ